MLLQAYDVLFNKLSDPRNRDWFLMSGPLGIIVILIMYLYAIYSYLPKYMEDKKPFNLKTIIMAYNIFQIIANCALVYGFLTSGWMTEYSFLCQPVDYTGKLGLRMLSVCWWTVMIKIFDLIETTFFILRKKQNQVSVLHVFHHVSTVIMFWTVTKFYGGGTITFLFAMNCSVHILMYTYYLLSSLGPEMQKRLGSLKQRMTDIQMIQFVVGIAHILNATRYCDVPKFHTYVVVPYVALNMAMFSNFYVVNYMKKKKVN